MTWARRWQVYDLTLLFQEHPGGQIPVLVGSLPFAHHRIRQGSKRSLGLDANVNSVLTPDSNHETKLHPRIKDRSHLGSCDAVW